VEIRAKNLARKEEKKGRRGLQRLPSWGRLVSTKRRVLLNEETSERESHSDQRLIGIRPPARTPTT